MKNKLEKIMNPRSVAVIGASNKPGSVGNELMRELLGMKFKGNVYPVHPTEKQIMGLPAYDKIFNIPNTIDLAVVAVPAKIVLDVVDECHKAKVKNLVVVSAGFKEVGDEGKALEQQLLAKITKYGMNMVGPNCLGVINTNKDVCLDASFAPELPTMGKLAFASQSGALASGIINLLPMLHLGVGQVISLGNQTDVSVIDAMEYWETDKNINQILLYLESIPNPAKFREVATRVSKTKPILCIKAGRSSMGAKASASHTGSLAGDDTTTTGLFASCGIIRELYLRDLFTVAQVIEKCPLPKGKKVAILTNVGGPGILATDACEDMGLEMSSLNENTVHKLKEILPPQASTHNPVDMIASAPVEHYAKSAEVLLKAPEVDMLVVIYLYITGKHDLDVLKTLEKLKSKYPDKPIVSVFMTTQDFNERISQNLPECSVPIFEFPNDAIRGLSGLYQRKLFLDNQRIATPSLKVNKRAVKTILETAKQKNIHNLSVAQSLEVFESYGLPIPKWGPAHTLTEAKKVAKQIGYPVVLKISSNTILHKSDVGGVSININNSDDLTIKWNTMVQRLKQQNLLNQVDNIVVMQQIVNSDRELVVGAIEKGALGHQIMFGIGGIFVEALKEVAFRPAPLSLNDANQLLLATKASKIMGNIRGKKAVDPKVMQSMLLRLSQLVTDFPDIKEIDANPLLLDDDGNVSTVDARIII